MDPSIAAAAATAATPTGLTAWIMTNGQMILFIVQVLWWILTALFLGYAVVQYKRWVNFQLGTGPSGRLRAAADDKKAVSVEEFVE